MRFTPALQRELEAFLRDLLELIQRCDKLDIFFFPSESTCPSPLKLGHYFVPDRGDFDGSETTFRRGHSEAVA